MSDAPTSPSPVLVTADNYAIRVRALLRAGGSPRAWPKRQADRWVLLHSVARRLGVAEELREREANERIQNWLLGPGAMLDVDFVTLRRALIDEGFWDREDGGARYRRSTRHQRRVQFESPLPDEAEILVAAEREVALRRETHGGPARG